ncbi:hypothetical protein Gbfr_030_002 [Gluconobacter frateurii M-2]|nr:hypothetical protein Gbfr_030_002 [Gluconobacter frateurii M-2]
MQDHRRLGEIALIQQAIPKCFLHAAYRIHGPQGDAFFKMGSKGAEFDKSNKQLNRLGISDLSGGEGVNRLF